MFYYKELLFLFVNFFKVKNISQNKEEFERRWTELWVRNRKKASLSLGQYSKAQINHGDLEKNPKSPSTMNL